MRRRPRLVGFLWRWHRRTGLVAALLALVLAFTGIALNHSPQWGFDRRHVSAEWVYRLYGEQVEELPAFRTGERWLYRTAAGRLYLDTIEAAPCRGELVGGQAHDGLVFAACAEELLLLLPSGALVESITASTGLPAPLSGIGVAGGDLVLRTGEGWLRADIERLVFDQPAPPGSIIEQGAPGPLPEALLARLPRREDWLSWERVLLDVHSGRIGGPFGVFLVDIAGLMLSLLGISGVAMWWLHRRGGQRSRVR